MYRMTSKLQAQNHTVPGGRRIQVRKSGVHGKGVFAARDIAKGEVLIEYLGERITWEHALDRHPHDPSQPDHTFYFHVDEGWVLDANVGGNAARWINHSCEPNCEPALVESSSGDPARDHIVIEAMRDIRAGEELCYDYGIVLEVRHTRRMKQIWACRCGAGSCTGTMLKPKPRKRAEG